MTVKPETRLWKTLKKYLSDGNYIVSRLESYVTPGFPDCLIFHNVTGFFTVELKVIQRNNKCILSPFQKAWNLRHSNAGAPVYILLGGLPKGHVKLFHGSQTKELGQCTVDQVPGLYEGRLEDLDFRKLPNSSHNP
mgnify:CR=1 FL=1|tara:strand:- start:269 stop:676 length:408 start_codon:yes stop_codon:yes gene_type:complete